METTKNISETFFKPVKFTGSLPEEEYICVQQLLAALDALSRSSNKSMYIIDYYKRNFLYVSPNPLFLNGSSVEDILKMGYAYYTTFVPDDDLSFLQMINKKGFDFFYNIPEDERVQYTISYDFHIITPRKKHTLINHKITPIRLNQFNEVWLALCIVTLAPQKSPRIPMIIKHQSPTRYILNPKTQMWDKMPIITLSDADKEILRFSAQGYSNQEIAEILFMDINTVKHHKKQIFKMMNVHNIAEAIGTAANEKLI